MYNHYHNLELGESNGPSLTGTIIGNDLVLAGNGNTHDFDIDFYPATSQKEGGFFIYQILVSPDNGNNWEVIRTTHKKDLYYNETFKVYESDGIELDTLHKDFLPDTYYLLKVRANYVLNGDTTFAESQTETFFTKAVKLQLVYVEKYTHNSITLKIDNIDNLFFNDYDYMCFEIPPKDKGSIYERVIEIPYGQTSLTIDNLEETKYDLRYSYIGHYRGPKDRQQVTYHSIFSVRPYEEQEGILEYNGVLYPIVITNKFQYSVIDYVSYYPCKGWHIASEEELDYIRINNPDDYAKYESIYDIVVKDK